MNRNYHIAFQLGVKAAEMVYGVSKKGREIEVTDAIWKLVQQIADSETTLLDTPEESLAAMPPLPQELAEIPGYKQKIEQAMKDTIGNLPEARRSERQMAQMIIAEWELLGLKRPK